MCCLVFGLGDTGLLVKAWCWGPIGFCALGSSSFTVSGLGVGDAGFV